MDSDYGVPMQEWLLANFKVLLLVESLAEPWFSEARVGTVVCAAERCQDAAERDANIVRWITLRQPLRALYASGLGQADHFDRVDALRDRLLTVDGYGEGQDFDWKCISQSDLRSLGTETS
jgi:hypothetical protein